ncbi:MAG: hypothetical protein QM739_16920 [Propionivibrio sp.]
MQISDKKARHSPPTTIRLAIAQRGRRLHNLWCVWSYKLKQPFVLQSDVALFHFAVLEADPTVEFYELEAPSLVTEIKGESIGTRFDARVRFVDGAVAWDEVKYELGSDNSEASLQLQAQSQLASQHGARYRRFTVEMLQPFTNRVWNCLRMLQVLQAAQSFSVASARTCILARLTAGPATIGELRYLDFPDEALNLAAIFGLRLEASATIDLDSGPITDASIVCLARQ